MCNQRRFDFHRSQTVPGNIEHVVNPTHNPVVIVRITVCAVPGNVESIVELLPIGINVALIVAPYGALHRRPGLADNEVSPSLRRVDYVTVFVNDGGLDTRQWSRA